MKSRVLGFLAVVFVSLAGLSAGSMASAAEVSICGGTFQPPCPPSEVCVYVGTFPECVDLRFSAS